MNLSESGTVTPGVASSLDCSESSAPTSPGPSSEHEVENGKPIIRPQDRRSGPSGYRFSTTCATVDDPNHKDQYGASSAPIYMSSTFKGLPGAEFDYSRSGNPTRSMLQHHLCQLQNCRYSFAVSSGMACLDVITRSLKPGERIVAGDDLYGGTQRLLVYLATHGGIATDHVDTTDASKVEEILAKRSQDASLGECGPVKMVLLETPTNPLLKVCDLERCARAAKRYAPDAMVVVDNTMMSPYLMRPLELGVDVVYDSGTKYLSGHHDLMAGVIACNREDLGKQMAFTINSIGNALTPMDSFLLLRGIKTLAVRMDRQQSNAIQVASYLNSLGFKVNYPGLPSHPGKDVHDAQASGPGSVLSFETGDKELSERIVGATRLWGISVSFGCVNSLISMPCLMSHASIDPKVRAARRLPEDLIRLCVGIEDSRDLIEDLESALLHAGAIQRRSVRNAAALGEQGRVPPSNSAASPASAGTFFARVLQGRMVGDAEIAALVEGVDKNKIETRGGDDDTSDDHHHGLTQSLLVSAPGKVILFGEHAVVHGVTAIAASVALRCYGLVEPRSDGNVSLALPDLHVVHEWPLDSLPWSKVPDSKPEAPSSDLNSALHKAIEQVVGLVAGESQRSHAASVAFLYLYMLLFDRQKVQSGQAFTLRSVLPIGAGLGSSASLSACLASAILTTQGHVTDLTDKSPEKQNLLNSYAFLSEKVIHGNPSGVDNAVAVHGGAISFARASERTKRTSNALTQLKGFRSFRFLLTDTRVGRDTKSLVAGVGQRLTADPVGFGAILDHIQTLSDRAVALLTDTQSADRNAELQTLAELIDANHMELIRLGVSHESLERIRTVTANPRFSLSTKLTGAGGGGCAVTLIPDTMSDEEVAQLKAQLTQQGFICYETTVGGPGVGLLPISPKDVSDARSHFQSSDTDNASFAQWAEDKGLWIKN